LASSAASRPLRRGTVERKSAVSTGTSGRRNRIRGS
jgi:hypothetical protein